MNISNIKWFRWLLLISIYVLSVLGVAGCSEGASVGVDCGSGWVWNGTVCSRRIDGFNWKVYSIALAQDGSEDLYAVGSFTHFKNEAVKYIARLNNDGSLDRGFISNTDFFSPLIVVSANDGSSKVYVGGYLSYNGPTLPIKGIARLHLDGSLDMSFDTGSGIGLEVHTIVPATDGSGDVYVSGFPAGDLGATFENWLIRLNSDGSLDTDFNSDFRASESIIALATDGSGDIYLSRTEVPYIARLNNDGSIDTGFNTGPSGFNQRVTAIAAASDGSGDIYVAGYFSEYNNMNTNGLVRLNSDGSVDSEFVVDTNIFNFQGGQFIVLALDNSGDIYVTNTNNQNIVRLNNDGSIDVGFGISSKGFKRNGDLGTIIDAAIAIDGSGDVYVSGSFTHYNLTPTANLARFTAGGILVK